MNRAKCWLVAFTCIGGLVVPLSIIRAEEPKRTDATSLDLAVSRELAMRRLNDDVVKKLSQPVDISFQETPLNDVASVLSDKFGVSIRLDSKSWAESGLAIEPPVLLVLKNKPLSHALNRMTGELGLNWQLDRGEVVITTAAMPLETRVYHIGRLSRLIDQRESDLAKQLPAKAFPAGVLPDRGSGSPHEMPEVRISRLLENAIAGQWMNEDGDGGTVSAIANQLIVRQTNRVHREISALLHGLEQVLSQPLGSKSMTIWRSEWESAEAARLRKRLDEMIEVEFVDLSLDKALEQLAAQIGEEIFIQANDRTVEVAMEVVQFKARRVNLPKIKLSLLTVLNRLSDSNQELLTIHDGAFVLIPNSSVPEQLLTTVIYDVSDLAPSAEDRDSLIRAIQETVGGSWQDQSGQGGTLTETATGLLVIRHTEVALSEIGLLLHDLRQAQKQAKQEAITPRANAIETRFYKAKSKEEAEALERLIVAFIATSTWDSSGGTGVIRTAEDRLIIQQTKSVHEQIDQFLRDYQQAKPIGQATPKSEGKASGE